MSGFKRRAVRDGALVELDDKDDVDFILPSSSQLVGTHANLVPLKSASQPFRVFYGQRFFNQALPIKNPEAPLVQDLDTEDEQGRSFDDQMGETMGAVRASAAGVVRKVSDKFIEVEEPGEDGKPAVRRMPLYRDFNFNRKTQLTQVPTVKEGDAYEPGQLLARSNFTDENGTMALGANARVAMVPYRGWTTDDAVAVSENFAKRMTAEQVSAIYKEHGDGVKIGRQHFTALFPDKFVKDQVSRLDDDGVVVPGTVLKKGDPIVLATRPKTISSASSALGKLSKVNRQQRNDASEIWDHEDEGIVTDVAKLNGRVKVFVRYYSPAKKGDKIVLRSGQKGTISLIIPQERMPRTVDGEPLDMLLNSLGIPSRINPAGPYEPWLGKIAKKMGKPLKVPSFLPDGTPWFDFIQQKLQENGLSDTEEVFDPGTNRKLERPVLVGNAYALRLHHTAESKHSERSQGAYDQDELPLKGSSEAARSKRLSGLEMSALASAGGYATQREGATLRGARNDDYWRLLRSGATPPPPGTPFVWNKFRTLLTGAGLHTQDFPDGRIRLGPMTDRLLDAHKPVEVRNRELVNLATLEPVEGGLFDPALVGNNAWGKISLPFPVANPAFEVQVRKLLGLTQKQYRDVIAGRLRLSEVNQ